MIRSLFRKADANPAAPLYAELTAAARQPGWYRDAAVPDTMDGRYCVLATLLALADIRLAGGSEAERALSPRLTELFVADMDAQLCQSGMGDPTLGKTVRAMVAGVAARIARLEAAIASGEWEPALGFALYRDAEVGAAEQAAAAGLIEQWRARLERSAELGAAR
ncbi:ubiquinol-cytochrome C chaperone family protein [Sphingomonas mesophila]|uniref:ubiquinol-cytochrome C chaperone family protein n=1 Tax=Sphingomonas mesophila TaxID=2303576 RepID=UPI000E582403|nr:ubiquinol-cytochrome C chaperone family protein [Sphingomonas mesophila]